jgi:hypothetical protein
MVKSVFTFSVPKFNAKLWSIESIFSLGGPRFNIELWKAKNFNFPNISTKVRAIESNFFLALQSLGPNFGWLGV